MDRLTEGISEMSLTELPECLPHEVQFCIHKSVFELSSNQLADEHLRKNGKRDETEGIVAYPTKSPADLPQEWAKEFFDEEDGHPKTAHEVEEKIIKKSFGSCFHQNFFNEKFEFLINSKRKFQNN